MDKGVTQFMGSQSQQPIMLQQPPFEVIGKQVFRRQGRGQETQYLIRFIGRDSDDAEVFASRNQLLMAQGGREALAAFEADLAPYHPGGLQDNGDDMGFDPHYTDNPLAPESDTRHMPWTQQPSEAQLPQTQQELSPNVDMPSHPHQDEPMPFGTSGRFQQRQPQQSYLTGVRPPTSSLSTVRGAHQGGRRVVNGLDPSLWEGPSGYVDRHQAHYSSPSGGNLSGVPAARSSAFAHLAMQSRVQRHPCNLQQGHSPPPQAPQPDRPSSHPYTQPQNASKSPAARMHTIYDTHVSHNAAQEQFQPQHHLEGMAASTRAYHAPSVSDQLPWDEQRSASPYGQPQPRGVFASLAAQSQGHYEAPTGIPAPEVGWRHAPAQAQHQPRNDFDSLATRSRHLDKSRQPSSAAQGQLASGQTALTGNQTGGSSLVHGVVPRQDLPQHHHSEWMGQQVPAGNAGGQGAQEASFSFAPAGAPTPPRGTLPPQMPGQSSALAAHRAPAQQPQSQRGRPVPASCQPAARTWQVHAHQLAAPSQPVLQQQAGAARQPGGNMQQSSGPHAYAASVRALQAPQRLAAEAQPEEQAQAREPGFYDTFVQNLSTHMEARAPAQRYAPASRASVIAQAPSMPQGPHEPSEGRTSQSGAEGPSMPSMPAEVHPALSRALAPARTALPAHHQGRAPEPQQGFEHQEPVNSSDDAADIDDAAAALAALAQEANQRIRARARQKSASPAEGQGTQLPYVSAPAWGAWVPAIQQMVLSKSTGKGGEAGHPAAEVAEDPIEGSPAPAPLQQQPLAAAAREMSSEPMQGRSCQHEHLEPAPISTTLDEEKDRPEKKKLRRLIKKAAEAMIVEAAAQADDSETGSSAERFIEQAFQPEAGEDGPVDAPVQGAEPAGDREQTECQGPGAAVDLTRGETPVPDSAAQSAGTPDNAEGDLLMRRLSEEGWKGAVIRRAKRQLGDNGEDELEVQIMWPDDFSAWVDRIELHMRPHTHLTLIRFYESKTRAK